MNRANSSLNHGDHEPYFKTRSQTDNTFCLFAEFIDRLKDGGLEFIGKDDKGVRMEILELKDHPWYVGVQFHPEYLSRVLQPSKPYLGFVAAAAGCLERVTLKEGVNGSVGELTNGLNGVRI